MTFYALHESSTFSLIFKNTSWDFPDVFHWFLWIWNLFRDFHRCSLISMNVIFSIDFHWHINGCQFVFNGFHSFSLIWDGSFNDCHGFFIALHGFVDEMFVNLKMFSVICNFFSDFQGFLNKNHDFPRYKVCLGRSPRPVGVVSWYLNWN